MFDGYIFVDTIPNNDSNQTAIHIYTRPFDLSAVKWRDTLSIYTTASLRTAMIYDDKNTEIRDSIDILNTGDVAYTIELPNEKTLWIYTYSCNSKSLNVIILFEYCNRYSLYAGRFIASDSMLFASYKSNTNLRALMQQNKIDGLFVDATTAHICEANLKYGVCKKIKYLMNLKEYKDCKIHVLIDDFGYESLLLTLIEMDIKIYVENERVKVIRRPDILQHFCKDRNAAQIILVDQINKHNVEKQFTEEKILSIELRPDDKVSNSKALKIIKFSVHPTLADISFIATLTAPLHIYTIGHSIDFPFKLSYLCRSANPMTTMKQRKRMENKENLEEI